jgi:hypothetical protein
MPWFQKAKQNAGAPRYVSKHESHSKHMKMVKTGVKEAFKTEFKDLDAVA